MSLKSSLRKERGFTIVELLIATAVFSAVLIIISFGIIQIGRLYYKNITTARTQEVARSISEQVSGSLQFSASPLRLGGTSTYCIGHDRYTFFINQKVTPNPVKHGLLIDQVTPGTCPPNTDTNGDKELLGENMRLLEFAVSGGELSTVRIKVAYGDDDLLTQPIDANSTCKGGAGDSFCAISALDTTVKRRVK